MERKWVTRGPYVDRKRVVISSIHVHKGRSSEGQKLRYLHGLKRKNHHKISFCFKKIAQKFVYVKNL